MFKLSFPRLIRPRIESIFMFRVRTQFVDKVTKSNYRYLRCKTTTLDRALDLIDSKNTHGVVESAYQFYPISQNKAHTQSISNSKPLYYLSHSNIFRPIHSVGHIDQVIWTKQAKSFYLRSTHTFENTITI